jgi:hypothetical protein
MKSITAIAYRGESHLLAGNYRGHPLAIERKRQRSLQRIFPTRLEHCSLTLAWFGFRAEA